MPSDYHILANIHEEIHISGFAKQMTGRLLDYAQRNNWMGRQITDIGCGTGESLIWLAQHGYIVTGIDQSSEMLAVVRSMLAMNGLSARTVQGNFLKSQDSSEQDMVLALNTLNELNNIRELERAFQSVHRMLKQGKWFIFDVYTIEGLVQRNQDGYMLEHDNDGLTIFVGNRFDYEKSIQYRDYVIFRDAGNSQWQREEAVREMRAYPIQGVTALVQRSGFDIQHVLNVDFSDHRPSDSTSRVIVMATKR